MNFAGIRITIILTVLLLTPLAAAADDVACGAQGEPVCPATASEREIVSPANTCPDGALYHAVGEGSCWSCPEGFVRPPGATFGPGSCQKVRGVQRRSAEDLRKPPFCPEGAVLDVREQACFACPAGYHRTLLPIDGGQGCQKGRDLIFTDAVNFGPLVCPDNGIVDPVTNGCFLCPDGFERDETHGIDHLDACMRKVFVKTLAENIGAPTCPPGSERTDKGCLGCPIGTILTPTTGLCQKQPCLNGLVADDQGLCQQPSAVQTNTEPLALPNDVPSADQDLPEGDEPELFELPEGDEELLEGL